MLTKHHHGDGLSRKHVTNDHLGDDVQTSLLIGNGLDNANWQDEEGTDTNADDVRPPREVGRPQLAGNHSKGKHDEENNRVPPLWYLGVLPHELEVDIGLLILGVLDTADDVPSVEPDDVADVARQCGEAHGV